MSSPAGAPQPTPEYLAEEKRYGPRRGLIITQCIAYFVLILRFYARYLIRSAGVDDYLMIAAAVVSVGTLAMCIRVIDLGAGRHIEAITPPAALVKMYQHLVGLQIIYHINLGLCRVSGVAFYARLSKNAGRSGLYMWIAFAFVTAVAVTQILILGLQCIPLKALWRDGPGKCMTQYSVFISTAAMTIICDSLVLMIPLRIIWGLKMNLRRKIALGVVLLIGVFAVATSVIRVIHMIPAVTGNDPTYELATVILWSVIEMSSAMVALSAPALKPLFGRFMTDNTSGSGGNKGFDSAQARGRRMSSYKLEGANKSSKGETAINASVENLSEEHLCDDPTPSGIRKTVEVQVTR